MVKASLVTLGSIFSVSKTEIKVFDLHAVKNATENSISILTVNNEYVLSPVRTNRGAQLAHLELTTFVEKNKGTQIAVSNRLIAKLFLGGFITVSSFANPTLGELEHNFSHGTSNHHKVISFWVEISNRRINLLIVDERQIGSDGIEVIS